MKIETERLTIRPFTGKDANDVHEYCSQAGVGEGAGWPAHESREQTSEILAGWMKDGCKHAIVWRETGQVVGHIAADPDSEEDRADTRELGCALNQKFQRRGVMTEAITAMLHYLFQNGIVYIWACCFQHNVPSKGMIEKCGFLFQQEGTYYSEALRKTFASYEYRLSADEWEAIRKER